MASTGNIIVQVYTSNARIPVEGSSVLFRPQDAPGVLLGFRRTDQSGITTPLSVSTADISYSQSPSPGEQPWTGINLRVEHPLFERVLLEGVQIFPGITTIQSVSLIPLNALDPEQSGELEERFTPQPISEGSK